MFCVSVEEKSSVVDWKVENHRKNKPHLVKRKIVSVVVGCCCLRLSGDLASLVCAGRKFTVMDSVNPSSSAAAPDVGGVVNLRQPQQKKQMSSSLNPLQQSKADCPRRQRRRWKTISRIISTITVVVGFRQQRFPT